MAKRLAKRFGCPVEFALDVLGGKWKIVILSNLKQGPLRYGELRALIPTLSDKMLTQRLKELEELGLVVRDSGLVAGGYALSPKGESLAPVLQALYDWGLEAGPSMGALFSRPFLSAGAASQSDG
ncbi:winged helix-turn-helix transcriptional regulator [Phenylobacterium montanum]|uniref:Helix-turn-helix transcriptional regulator n=1 Tax=Phenylobacterium montanum TaxID=2823693 RepID=A0A975G493_9CAUL|nr:helix-turn-helix domain-containing protein [Caulobacter sp. S6]QUD90279.1 helix-turn-helix transcriptional regulator [Caulobacter sp. S6]